MIEVRRQLTPAEATELVGTMVAADLPATVPPSAGEPVWIRDADSGQLIGLVTRLPDPELAELRWACRTMGMAHVARMSGAMRGDARTFGKAPRRVVNRRESCRPADSAREYPRQHRVLTRLGATLSREFAGLYPTQAAHDGAVMAQVNSDWRMDPDALWTSGVVNRTSTLPYHRDSANFYTWSAMPTLRHGMVGGHLHLPEYGLVFPCADGDVTWFCGKELVHGVTTMRPARRDAYRFSVVYYATAAMKSCRTLAEETAAAAQRRTERERRMADEVRGRIGLAPAR